MNALSSAIWTQLKGGTALTALLGGGTAGTAIYEDHAPSTATFPYVVFNEQAGTWNQTMGENSRFVDCVYQVKAVTNVAYPQTASAIDAQIDTRLHNATLTVTGYAPLACEREADIQYSESVGAQVFQHVGALYRVTLQKS